MYVENNEMHGAFNPSYKHSMAECYLKTTPTLNKGDIEITFGGENFSKLLEAANVSAPLIQGLLERKRLVEETSRISSLTKSSSFYPMEENEPLEDLYSELYDMADCYQDGSANSKDRLKYFAERLAEKDGEYFENVLCLLDNFAECFDKALSKKEEKEGNESSTPWYGIMYDFQSDGIVVSPELGLKIQNEMYTELLKNTKSYVEIHGSYIIERDLAKVRQKATMQKSLLEYVRKGEHRVLKHESEAYQAVLLDIVKDFATHYGFYDNW